MKPDNHLRAIKMIHDLEHIDDVLAHRKMEFKGLDYGLEKELRRLATVIVRKLKPLTKQEP